MCVDVKKLGFIDKGTGEHESNIVYDANAVSPCVTASFGVKQPPAMTVESQIVAMRGRNPENPSDRTAGIHLEQRLEPNSENICNTLTSVQKDNLVLETDKLRVGELKKIKVRQATKDGFIECELPGVADLNYPNSNTRRGRVIEGGR